MGNTSTMVIFWVSVSMMSMLITLGILAVDPCSDNLFSAYVQGQYNPVNNVIGSTSYICANGVTYSDNYNFDPVTMTNNVPSRATTGDTGTTGATTSVQFPDWLQSGWKWITTVGFYILNLVGAPYTLIMSFGVYPGIAAIVGVAFAILNMFFIVNWILGRDN